MRILAERKKALIVILAMLLVSPFFGVIGSEIVGYHEPLDIAAEKLGLKEEIVVEWSPFSDYTVPGLPNTLGYIVAGFLGVGIILAIGLTTTRIVGRKS